MRTMCSQLNQCKTIKRLLKDTAQSDQTKFRGMMMMLANLKQTNKQALPSCDNKQKDGM